jgi:hypothetical protein
VAAPTSCKGRSAALFHVWRFSKVHLAAAGPARHHDGALRTVSEHADLHPRCFPTRTSASRMQKWREDCFYIFSTSNKPNGRSRVIEEGARFY